MIIMQYNIKELKKELGLKDEDLAKFFGLKHRSYSSSSAKKRYEQAFINIYKFLKDNYQYKYKHKYATFYCEFEPSTGISESLNEVAELMYMQFGGVNADIVENNASLTDVVNYVCPKCGCVMNFGIKNRLLVCENNACKHIIIFNNN